MVNTNVADGPNRSRPDYREVKPVNHTANITSTTISGGQLVGELKSKQK